jgi:dicarboxylate transporter 10
MGIKVVKNDGILGLYNGLSASLLRQMTYSLTRFAIYETVKGKISDADHPMPFYQKVLLGAGAGCIGGIVGTPGDMVNVRMQNDMKLPAAERRNYKHALDGLLRVAKEEGPVKLMSGATMASSRATLVTVGQLSFYDQFKQILLLLPMFKDNMVTHFTASFMAGGVATFITMPVDVMKTRLMSAPPGTYRGLGDCAKDIAKSGPMGFFKGFIPAFVRLGPQTILTFIFFEQLRLNFGVEKK